MKKPNSCRECEFCKVKRTGIECSVLPKDNKVGTYENEMNLWRKCPIGWDK